MRRVLIVGAVAVLGLAICGSAQSFGGSWQTKITLDPQQALFTDAISFTSTVKADYTIGGWTFGSSTVVGDTGWTDQDLTVQGSLGAFSITGAVDLDPSIPLFQKLSATATGTIADVLFTTLLELYDGDAFLTLTASAAAGLLTVDASIAFGDDDDPDGVCDLDFSSVKIGVDFPFCCAEVESEITFSCIGFEKVTFSAQKIEIPGLPWVTLDASLEFTLQTKSLTLTPNFDFSTGICIDFYIAVSTFGNIGFESLYIDGVKLECDFGDVKFTGISFWGTHAAKPSALGDYWEMYKIESVDDACCGPFEFDIAVFFEQGSPNLFDVAAFEANLDLTVSSTLSFDMTMEYEINTGLTLWTFGFTLKW